MMDARMRRSAAIRARVLVARGAVVGTCISANKKAHNKPAVCAEVSPCGSMLISITTSAVGGGGDLAPRLENDALGQTGVVQNLKDGGAVDAERVDPV